MKKFFKISFSVLAVILVISLSVIPCFAKGALLLDDEVSIGYKDTVTYTLWLADCEKPVTDMVAYLFYDSDYLELDKDSVDFHDLAGVNSNTSLDGYIPFNFSVISSPVDFSKRTAVVSADFKVIKEGKSSIKYFIGELDCGSAEKSETVKKFSFTCDYTIHSTDGDKSVENKTPILLDDKDTMNNFQGSFINYADGKGEQKKSGKEHIAVTGEVQDDVENVTDVTKDISDNNMTIIIAVAVVVIILVIAIIVVLRRVFGSDSDEEEQSVENEK